MTEFDIKADKRLFHHYIIAVGMDNDIRSEKCGRFYLKYKPIHFTHDDIEKVRDALMLSQDKVFKTTQKEASTLYECDELIHSLTCVKYACLANSLVLHHFSSQEEIEEEIFVGIVENAHRNDRFRDLLKESILK